MSAEIVADLAAEFDAGPERWADLAWRLDNLYWIVDKQGNRVRFVMNKQQRQFIARLWNRNLILKARQLGFSTLIEILQLDQALFNVNHAGVVIADTMPNASKLLGKVEYAYDTLPAALRLVMPLQGQKKGLSLTIDHRDESGQPQPSTISVGVSARGGTVQLLHVSELGKMARKHPQRAEEVRTGAIPAVPIDGGIAIVESTAEGAFGEFYDLCEPALKRKESGEPETALDWRLHFFPWYEADEYRLSPEDTELVPIPPEKRKYFDQLERSLGIVIDGRQRAWYVKTEETLRRKMKQEYPSTPQEAFEQAVEGAILGDEMSRLRKAGRIASVALDINYPVNTFWDFGVGVDNTGGGDTHSIWFHQQVSLEHRWFYYVSGHGKGLRHWWMDVCEAHRDKHGYRWGKHYVPHDADTEMLGEVVETKHRILEKLGMRNIVVVPRVQTIGQGIEIMRRELAGNHWFDKRTPDEDKGEDLGCGKGIKGLDGYQFEWDEKRQIWGQTPLHNWASHPCDAWRQFAQAKAQGLFSAVAANDDDHDQRRRGRRRNWKTA